MFWQYSLQSDKEVSAMAHSINTQLKVKLGYLSGLKAEVNWRMLKISPFCPRAVVTTDIVVPQYSSNHIGKARAMMALAMRGNMFISRKAGII